MAFSNMILSQQLIDEKDLWVVEFAPLAVDALQVLPKQDAGLLIGYLDRQLHGMPNPRSIGKKLFCDYGYLWRYRVGNFRLVAQLDHKRRAIIVLMIEKRFCDLMADVEAADQKADEVYEAEWKLIEEKRAKQAKGQKETEQQEEKHHAADQLAAKPQKAGLQETGIRETEPKKDRLDEVAKQQRERLKEATRQRKAVKRPVINIFH